MAPPSVAMRSTSIAGSEPALSSATLAISAARRASPKMSRRLLLAGPSVPSATLMPARTIAETGAIPLASFRFDVGQ